MILLDANALIALLRDEPAAPEVAALLRSRDCGTPAPCLAEVVDRLIRRAGVRPEDIGDRLGPLIEASLAVVSVDNGIAWQAGELRGVRYARKGADLSLADCLLLASAGAGGEIATADGGVVEAAGALGIGVIPLPDSSGHRPAVG